MKAETLVTYSEALGAAQEVVAFILPYVERVEICGSLRRKKQEVRDIDIVCQATDRFSINTVLSQVCTTTNPTAEKLSFVCRGIPGEIYFTANEQQFEVMKL